MESKIAIVSFIDDPVSTQQIAALHLEVRFLQRADGENQFRTDIFDSQADLSNIEGYYKEPGGNFL